MPPPFLSAVETRLAAGEHLVHVGLVAGVEQDDVSRRVEHAVHGDGQLNDAEVGPEVAPGPIDGLDDEVANFGAEFDELAMAQLVQIGRVLDGFECQGTFLGSGAGASRSPCSVYNGTGRRPRAQCRGDRTSLPGLLTSHCVSGAGLSS